MLSGRGRAPRGRSRRSAKNSAGIALSLCFGLAAACDPCDSTIWTCEAQTKPAAPMEPVPTLAQIVRDMKSACVPCHTDPGGTALSKFVIPSDNSSLYKSLMTSGLIDRAVPENSPLIRAGRGQLPVGNPPAVHAAALTASKATSWIGWIKAGLKVSSQDP